jgi:YYY domain-containing protein
MVEQLFFWWLCSLAFGIAAWPLVYLCMRKMPDRGLGFTRIAGLLFVGYLFWLGGMVHLWPNVPLAVWAAAVFLLMVGAVFQRNDWMAPWRWLKDHWKDAVVYEAVFLFLFVGVAWIRANNPEAVGTEKPMELAFINAILRSPYFPPNDPWLSGFSISYYYFGYVLTAMIASVASISGAVAFNLGSATSYALAGLGAYGVLRNILCVWDPFKEQPVEKTGEDDGKAPWRRRQNRIRVPLPKYMVLSLLAPCILLVVGNLEGSLEWLYSNHIGWQDQNGYFWKALDIQDINKAPSETVTGDSATWRFWWWWRASRVINDLDLGGHPVEVIDEFPGFSLTLGDLHPHILGMPFLMLGLALALEFLLRAGRIIGSRFERWAFYIFSALSLGSILFINTWDFPALFGLVILAGLVGWLFVDQSFTFLGAKGWLAYMLQCGAMAIAAGIAVSPFLLTFASQAGGLLPNVLFPSHGSQYLVMFGALLVPLLAWLGWESFRGEARPDWESGLIVAGMGLAVLLLGSLITGFAIAVNPDLIQRIASSLSGMDPLEAIGFVFLRRLLDPLPTILPFLLVVIIIGMISTLWKRKELIPPNEFPFLATRIFPWLLVIIGSLLAVFPEYFYLRDMFGTRMNTVFKFYFQTWQYWCIPAAIAVIALVDAVRRKIFPSAWLMYGTWSGLVLSLIVLIAGAVYLPLAVWTKTNGFAPGHGATLDAAYYFEQEHPMDAGAIQWLAANYAGQGPVAEAVGGQYSEYARVATLTGIPTVLGWGGHEDQWRGGSAEIGNRAPDIQLLFATQDWTAAREVLDRYKIRYVFFGELELRDFGPDGLAKFKEHLDTLYQMDPVYIFEWTGQ